MTDPVIERVEGAELLQGSSRGSGNRIYKIGDRVLKLYRCRGSLFKEFGRAISNTLFEGKRAGTVADRYKTEGRCLGFWSEQGFDVFKTFDEPLPEGVDPPGRWFEFCEGRNLGEIVNDASVDWDQKVPMIERLSAEMGRRHHLALQLGEPLLIQEHGTPNHIFITGDRMLTFDFENAFKSGYPVMVAIGQELGGYLRGLARRAKGHDDEVIEVFATAYPKPEILKEAAHHAVHGGGVVSHLRRRQDQRRRPTFAKTDVLRRVLKVLSE